MNPFQFGGGAEYQINCLVDALKPLGAYDIYYLARHTNARARPDGAYTLVKIGATEVMPRFGYVMDAPLLNRALARIRPHVIYQRVACGYTGICAYYARKHGASMIWHVAHDKDVSEGGVGYGRNPVRVFLERATVEYGIRHTHHIVVQKEQQARLLKRHYHRTADEVIPNFHPEPGERLDKSGPLTVVWVANLKRWKQPEVFVRLAQALTDLAGVRFIMIGLPENGDREWSAPLMSSIEATRNLEYWGQKPLDEVNATLARAHVFVNTSVEEGFPNTFIQAWMRGVPVVSLSVNPDGVFDHEEVGFHGVTEEGLAKAVRTLLTDEALRARYAARSREYAVAKHSVKNAQRLVRLIDAARAESRVS